jgi:hypothetical protein
MKCVTKCAVNLLDAACDTAGIHVLANQIGQSMLVARGLCRLDNTQQAR